MKTRGFFNLDQAIQYLGGSFIRVAGHPVVIQRVDSGNRNKGNFKLTYMKIDDRDGREYSILSDAEEVDMNPMEMGMLATKPGNHWSANAQYLARVPQRAMKVGATRQSIWVNPVINGGNRIDSNCVYSTEFCDMVKGKYMSFQEVLEALNKKKGSYPFSRRFAVDYNSNVYYKTYGDPVGKVDAGEVVLSDDAFFLREVLKEDLNVK